MEELALKYIDKGLLLDCLKVPTYTSMEDQMVSFIEKWADDNKIRFSMDDYGNVYLEKGDVKDGEYYPCVTSHLDTVQDGQITYAIDGSFLELKEEYVEDKDYHKISVDSDDEIGTGSDDKNGICVCLSLFGHFDVLKACFFVEEEDGCNGSKHLDTKWFDNVGYVVGFDSPERYRAAWSCDGVELFGDEFYYNHIKDVCDSWGITDSKFRHEPYTDVKYIRLKTGIVCMNFGNGGYLLHSKNEYCVVEDVDAACGLGVELIEALGHKRYMYKTPNTNTVESELVRKMQEYLEGLYNGLKNDISALCFENGYDFSPFKKILINNFEKEDF